MSMKNQALSDLKNIGKTVEAKLRTIGITGASDLKNIGAAKAYKRLSALVPSKHLPVCYYLYSLEGAIRNRHWNELSESEKKKLRIAAGLGK